MIQALAERAGPVRPPTGPLVSWRAPMPGEKSRREARRLGPRIALLALASAISLALVEVGARWLLPPPQVVRVADADHAARRAAESARALEASVPHHPEEAGGRLYVDTPTGRRLRANARIVIERHALSRRRIVIETNSLGYRNRELGPKAGRRLLFLGDSITFGDYVDDRETFVRRIEAHARADGRDWETVNAGVGGIGIDHEIAILLETGIGIDPDVVVLDFYLNDFQASPGIRVIELPRPLDRSVALYSAAHAIASGWAALRIRLGGPAEDGIDWPAWAQALESSWPPPRDPEEATFRRLALSTVYDWGGAFSPRMPARVAPRLRELAGLAEQHGFRLVVVAFPVREQVEARGVYDAPQRWLAHELEALGVPVLDLLPVLRAAHRDRGAPLFYDHCHPTPRGNAIVAEAVYDFLVEETVVSSAEGARLPEAAGR